MKSHRFIAKNEKMYRGMRNKPSQITARSLSVLLLFFCSVKLSGQITKITHLKKSQKENHTQEQSILWGLTDTLTLPIFEDFTHSNGYPSSTHWADKQVWVNNSFCPNTPNAMVATFDHLNDLGNPYQTLSERQNVFADSLTSQPINLQFYSNGTNTVPYRVTDDIYLSFFFINEGLGDVPEPQDSLILFFKGSDGQWHRVWSAGGKHNQTFEEVYVKVDTNLFFVTDFQFRWVNYTKATGNLNHWHIDYIRMDKNRDPNSNEIEDVGIVSAETGLLYDYTQVPYQHYIAGAKKGNGANVRVKNLNESSTVQTRYRLKIRNDFNQVLFNQDFSVSSRNILAGSDSTEKFNTPVFDTLSGETPGLIYDYTINPRSNDNTPDNFNTTTDNNEFSVAHKFMPWYAYDDGSAEGGFGLDYAYLGNLPGQFAMEFNTSEDDTLRGISMYFTQVKEDVSFRSFRLRIWRKISEVGADDKDDILMYEIPISKPVYRDSINHFEYFFFDTALYLQKGKYYVGWKQDMPFILNVGYDNNYRFGSNNEANPHLFYNLLGSWERADYSIKGTPMIRMMFGESVNYKFHRNSLSQFDVNIYPNPCSDVLHIGGLNQPIQYIHVYDQNGRVVMKEHNTEFSIKHLNSGLYFMEINAGDHIRSVHKIYKK